MLDSVEIMAPVGSWDALRAAIQAKASSIYLGIGHLHMRSHAAQPFSVSDLPSIVSICEKEKIEVYVTLNAILYDSDLALMRELCQAMKKNRVSAVIASDIAAIQYAHELAIPIHISTQMNVSNIEAVRFYAQFADTIVLARELSLSQIQSITEAILREKIVGPSGKLIRIELFIHGALCVSLAGKCSMSLALNNQSANRGACVQPCRRRYRVIDEDTEQELIIDNRYVMSPKDLCTIGMIDQIIKAGVSILKIEGRGRSPEYVLVAVSVYREAVEAVFQGTYSEEKVAAWRERLRSVYNRGFWENGYYLGQKAGEWSGSSGSQALRKKEYVGKVTNYYSRASAVECILESQGLKVGSSFLITGPTTGVVEGIISEMHEKDAVIEAKQGARVAFPLKEKVRKNDKLFIYKDMR